MTLVRLRHVAQVNPPTPEFDRMRDDDVVTFLPLEAIWPGAGLDTSRLRPKREVSTGYTRFRRGDILIPKITPTFQANRSVIAAGLVGLAGAGTTELHVVRPRPGVEPRYLLYWLSSLPFLARGEAAMIGVAGQKRVPDDHLRDYEIELRPLEQQRAIADYLDAETARIDQAIRAIQRSLDLIVQLRKSLIMAAFSQPCSPSRGSTVRALAEPLLGRQRSPEQAQGPNMVRYLRAANVKDGRLDLDDVMEMNFNPVEQRTFSLRPGDILITEGAGSLAAVGANAVWNGDLPGTICFQNTLIRLRPKDGSEPRFIAWWARFAYESGLLAAAATGANIYHLGVETVRALPAWAPPLGVQREVSDHLDHEVSKLQHQANLRNRQIDVLLERRQALITAAVTGQLEIPGVAA